MNLFDKNQSWTQPEGYTFEAVVAEGAYLRFSYTKPMLVPGWKHSFSQVVIYVNDQGREIMRTEAVNRLVPDEPDEPVQEFTPKPITRWHRFCSGCYLILTGLEEMSKCLKG